MIKSSSIIYLFSLFPQFNPEKTPNFGSFDKDSSIFLYNTLLLNHKENLKDLEHEHSVIFCFDENDRSFLNYDVSQDNAKLFFGNSQNKSSFIKNVSEKYSDTFSNHLVLFNNSIGITKQDIKKALDLISIEDEAVVIGKTPTNKIAFVGFNSYREELFKGIDSEEFDFNKILANASKLENFIQVMKNYMLIKDVSDFKDLYRELSKKESLEYCSQHIHERFTNLFIEFKELLK